MGLMCGWTVDRLLLSFITIHTSFFSQNWEPVQLGKVNNRKPSYFKAWGGAHEFVLSLNLMTQTVYPNPGDCQLCLPHHFPAETTTDCISRVPWEASCFACSLLLPWLVRSGFKRAVGSPVPADPASRVVLMTGTLQPSAVPSLNKHTTSVLVVKCLQSILAASVGSSKQCVCVSGMAGQQEDVCCKKWMRSNIWLQAYLRVGGLVKHAGGTSESWIGTGQQWKQSTLRK